MEMNETENTMLCQHNLGESSEDSKLLEAHSDADFQFVNALEALDHIENADATSFEIDKEVSSNQVESSDALSNIAKESTEMEKPKSVFHLSDNMKKDLSMLTFPSKAPLRKKGLISVRTMPNSRITIAEALEKAEDARKSISNSHIMPDTSDTPVSDTCDAPAITHTDKSVDEKEKESQDVKRQLPPSVTPEYIVKIVKKLDSTVTSQSVADGSPPCTSVNESASCSEGQPVLLAGKAKPGGTARIQMTQRMLELLKFTFIHEHFPSSVHTGRLARMMGLPWPQIRNWFTDRRVDNKKAGIYLRDRPLLDCPYCNVALQTEPEQKSHLFSPEHVKKILGSEFCGGISESIKWKKLSGAVNAVSTMSGAKILAVGVSADNVKKGIKVQEKKKMETTVGTAPHSKELKKLWTEAMLPPEGKEKSSVEWSPGRINFERNVNRHHNLFTLGKKESVVSNLKIEQEKVSNIHHHENLYVEKVVKSRVISMPVKVGDIPVSESDSPAPVNDNASTTSSTGPVRDCESHLVNTNVASTVTPQDLQINKSHQNDDIVVLSESPKKFTALGKKESLSSVLEPPIGSQRATAFPSILQKGHKVTIPRNTKPKKESSRLSSDLQSLINFRKEKKFSNSPTLPSHLARGLKRKQLESDESGKNVISSYKSDNNYGFNRYKVKVATKGPLSMSPSSASILSNSQKSLHFQKKISPAHDSSIVKIAVNKSSKTNIDKKKVKFRTQPLGSVLRANKSTTSAYEGNIIVGYQCPNCNKVFQTEWLMMKHSVTHFKYQCDICYKMFPTENMMKVHLLDHLSGAYEDEKYYCQFSCKVCHSLKCGCYEPTYCKPQSLPSIYIRPQKARRSKKGFISKLNSGPNDHLKISLSSYKKLLLFESVGQTSKEKATLKNPNITEDAQNVIENKKDQDESVVKSCEISTLTLKVREAHMSNVPVETPKVHQVEKENQECIGFQDETKPSKEKVPDSVSDISDQQLDSTSNVSALETKTLTTEKKKQPNLKEVTRNLTSKPDVPFAQPSIVETENPSNTKRAGGRRRTNKTSSNFIYDDPDFYYMCEICDANFSSKAELSEHMFLHRLKARSRGEKRDISCVSDEKESPNKVKVHEVEGRFGTKAVAVSENHKCEDCYHSFPTIDDYRAHRILAHREPKPQPMEVYRCNYCDKIYRRRRELKRHLKRDCQSIPPSVKGKLSGLFSSTNVIGESHYTVMNVEYYDKSDMSSKLVTKGNTKGPIICKYCLAVTKREAEMKRHIWKFCLKIPPNVVQKFMDGTSLEELGFKYLKDSTSPEASPSDISQNTQDDIKDFMGEIQTIENPELKDEKSPKKCFPTTANTCVQLESPKASSSSKYSLQMSYEDEASTMQDTNIAKEKVSTVLDTSTNSDAGKHSLEMETSSVQSILSDKQDANVVHLGESKKAHEIDNSAGMESPTKPIEETNIESCSIDETPSSATSTSPLANPVMQFPHVIPVLSASTKSKRPLVCGYCGIWYFREMAILKHMKERCIKIPNFEKEFLKINNTLCTVSQKGEEDGIGSENGALYKMVKIPEHLQNASVPVPKDVTNEDIKILSRNIKTYGENSTKETKSLDKEDNAVVCVSLPETQTPNTPTKRGSRCRRCHEHFNSQEAVLAHSSIHHGPKKGFYKCKLCHARMVKYKHLREHVWEHTNEYPYRCHLCDVRYRSSDTLVEHLSTQHQYTSINDKNLFKWLPGRHGKYRDIKTNNSNCEEKLDNSDANLDSLAEVMVITDKDICSNTTSDCNLKEDENKPLVNSEDGQNAHKKSENLHELLGNENSSETFLKSNETLKLPVSSDAISNSQCATNPDVVSVENINRPAMAEKNTMENSEKNLSGKSSVKNAAVQGETDSTSPAKTLSTKSYLEQQKVIVKTEPDDDKDCEPEVNDGLEEVLLPNVENLESVVETIQLTDNHLS